VIAAVVVFVVAGLVMSGPLEAKAGGGDAQQISLVLVIVQSLVAGLAGWGLLVLLERFTAHGRRIWTIIAAVILVVSLAGPAGGTTTGSVITLILLHLVVGAILIVGLRR
jgi:hypothetical protein